MEKKKKKTTEKRIKECLKDIEANFSFIIFIAYVYYFFHIMVL